MRKVLLGFLIAAVGLWLVPWAQAAEFVQPDKQGQANVPAAETHNNLYVVGATVVVNGATNGDLTAAGGTVSLIGPVSGELLAAGGNINVDGPVKSTARVAGGTVIINNSVGGDLLVGGGNISVEQQAPVSGDLVAAGGNVTVNAPVGGSARLSGGSVTLNSKVNGNVYVNASRSLTLGPNANISGTVYYRGTQPAQVDGSAKLGGIEYTHVSERGKTALAGILALGTLIALVAYIIVGFLLLWLRRKAFEDIVDRVQNHFWASLGLGFAGLVLTPIAVVILFVTFVGFYAALILLAIYILVLLMVTVASMLFLGRFILHLINTKAEKFPNWQVVLVGVIAWGLLKLIPVVGWLILAIIYLVVFGGAVVMMKNRLQRDM